MYPSPFFKFWVSTEFVFSLFNAGFCEGFFYLLPSMGLRIFLILFYEFIYFFVFLFKKIKLFSHLRAFLANPGSRYTEARFGIYYLYWSQCKFKSYVLRLKNYPGKWFKGTTTNISEEIFLIWSDQNTFAKRCYDMKIFIVHVGKLCFAK